MRYLVECLVECLTECSVKCFDEIFSEMLKAVAWKEQLKVRREPEKSSAAPGEHQKITTGSQET